MDGSIEDQCATIMSSADPGVISGNTSMAQSWNGTGGGGAMSPLALLLLTLAAAIVRLSPEGWFEESLRPPGAHLFPGSEHLNN